ncbi:MAG: hypothetical protein JNL21_35945 [Myxococcales bacterium]|nr:hypothetical protein [Myxococcales bacterium]
MSPRRASLRPSSHGRPERALALAACLSFSCGPAAPPAPAVVRPAPVDAARLTEIYSSFSYGNCQSGSDCPAVFAKAVGADLGPSGKRPGPNPRATMKNPDPEWLPEWERLPESEARAHYTYEALALAAVQRSWSRACDEAYRAYDKAVDERMTALDRAIAEKNRDPNPYDRLGALLALEPEEPKKEGMGEFVKGSDAVRYRWEAAVFEAFEDTARTFVYSFDAYAPSEALVSTMRPRQPEAYERDAFCLDAAAGKIPGVKPLPDTSAWDTDVRGMVKLAVPTSRAQAVEQRRKELTTQVRLKFQKAMLPDPKLPPGVRELEIANISRFERDGRAAVITSTATREERAGSKTVKIDETVRTTFADWPSGVVLEPGDSVAFYGTESRVKDTTIRSTPELEHLSRETALEAKHITRLTAKGQTKKYFR